MSARTYRYFIKFDDAPQREITEDEFMQYEKSAGFTSQHPGRPATSGFSGWISGQRVRGTIQPLTALR